MGLLTKIFIYFFGEAPCTSDESENTRTILKPWKLILFYMHMHRNLCKGIVACSLTTLAFHIKLYALTKRQTCPTTSLSLYSLFINTVSVLGHEL